MKLLHSSIVTLGLIGCTIGIIFVVFRVRSVTSDVPVSKNVLHTFVNTNLIFTNYTQKITDITKKYPEIASISVEKKFPSEMALTVKKSLGTLAIYDRENYVIISKSGIVMRLSDSSENLQTLTYFRELPDFSRKKGSSIQFDDIRYVLKLQAECTRKKYALARNIVIPSPTLLELHFAQKPLYTITTQKSVAKNAFLVHNMQQVIQEKNIQATVVDLRYELPVIKQ